MPPEAWLIASAPADPDVPRILLELGVGVVLMALLARLGDRLSFSPIPLYLLAGLALGEGGLLPLSFGEDFIAVGAQIGVMLLLFLLGLEYTGEELTSGLQAGWRDGLANLLLNFLPGFAAGLALGWGWVGAVLLGGVTFNTSSGVMAKLLTDLGRLGNRETPSVLVISVMEDLTNAVYLPLLAVLLLGVGWIAGAASMALALAVVVVVLVLATRFGPHLSRVLDSRSDETVLLTLVGLLALVAGLAELLQISAAIAAFLLGIAVSEPIAERARSLLNPLRDLFAALFFLFFGLQVDPAGLPAVMVPAVGLAVGTTATKIATGWLAAARRGVGRRGRMRAGTALVPRGEFSIVIAGLGVAAGVDVPIGPLAAAYVLLLAVAAPLLVRYADRLADALPGALPRRGAGAS